MELQITQTWHPKVLRTEGQTDRVDPLLDVLSLKRRR